MAEKLYDAYQQEIELTKEQEACVKYTGDRTLMVKGYAGAGKSLVLMVLAQKYLQKYGADAKNKVAIFTFQNTLVSTTRELLHVNGHREEGVVVSTINSYIKEIYEYFVKVGVAPRRKFPFIDSKDHRLVNVKKAISEHQTKHGKHRLHDLDEEFWLSEFDWMKDMNVWTDDEEYYLGLPRKGRGSKVRMSALDRIVAYQMFVMYCKLLEKTGCADWADQTLFVIRHYKEIPKSMKFDHILIDEAQDLSLAQMIAIMHLYNEDMIVAMDMNQKIHNRSWTAKQLGIDSTTKKLTKSMRTTKQIDDLAESVRSKNDVNLSEDDKSLRAIPEREGALPQLVHLENAAAEQKYVVNLVKSYIEQNPNLTIGIIAAKRKQIKIYSDWLSTANIPHEQVTKDTTFSMSKPGVKVVTAFGAKGLEFNCVIIPMFAEGKFPFKFQSDDEEEMAEFLIKMRNLVYVSMTRAKNYLTITYWGKGGSRFIAEMDSNMYQLVGAPNEIANPKVKNAVLHKKEETSTKAEQKEFVKPSLNDENVSSTETSSLASYLKDKGLEVIDKRAKGGALWVVGDKSISPSLADTKEKYGALWTFCAKGGNASKHRPAWFSQCKK